MNRKTVLRKVMELFLSKIKDRKEISFLENKDTDYTDSLSRQVLAGNLYDQADHLREKKRDIEQEIKDNKDNKYIVDNLREHAKQARLDLQNTNKMIRKLDDYDRGR